jgi:hypothetical protein
MRARTKLTLSLAFGTACYVSLLWKGQQSFIHSLNEDHSSLAANAAPLYAQQPYSSIFLNARATHYKRNVPEALSKFKDPRQRKYSFRPNPGDDRPPFETVVDDSGNITGNTENLLHFAVIGFGKCGTTSMISWLDKHPEIETYPREIYDLMLNQPAELIRKIYTLPVGDFKRGYKSPVDLSLLHSMDYFRQYFPKTKLIVGIRHPLRWFESLYNFRVQNLKPNANHSEFPTPNELIGRCFKSSRNTCTYKGEFALFLRNLGKTLATHNARDPSTGKYTLTELETRMYKGARFTETPDIQEVVLNPVFLFEMNQLADEDEVRSARFRRDVQEFLELESPLAPMIHFTPGKSWMDDLQSLKDDMKINICDDEHIPVRKELMRITRSSSLWIKNYFLDPVTMATSGIHVSSPSYFMDLLDQWMKDPCGEEATRKAGRYIIQAVQKEERSRLERGDHEKV